MDGYNGQKSLCKVGIVIPEFKPSQKSHSCVEMTMTLKMPYLVFSSIVDKSINGQYAKLAPISLNIREILEFES